jgi:phenylalanyl-tRNA synthetase alpha chain
MTIENLAKQLLTLEKLLKDVKNQQELQNTKAQFLGKKSVINELMATIPNVSPSERKEFGSEINNYRSKFTDMISARASELEEALINAKLQSEAIDFTEPYNSGIKRGTEHILIKTINELTSIMTHLGFKAVAGQEIEDDYHNFTALNVPQFHPARQSQDTFYTDNNYLLRTQTSSVQIRHMESNKPPHYIFSIGKVYRIDSIDNTHLPMFHQIECLAIDKNITLLDLKETIHNMLKMFFLIEDLPIRFRSSYFPFTKPSLEVDIMYRGRWLELGGCGIVHDNVLKNVNIDSTQYSGFAFGMGIERFAMVKHSITDIRMFVENDIRFLRHYS